MAARSIDGPEDDWLDMRDMIRLTKMSEATIRRLMKSGVFPPLQEVSPGSRFWHWTDYLYWTLRVQKFGFPRPSEGDQEPSTADQ